MRARDAHSTATQQTIQATKQKPREEPQQTILDIARSDCTTAVSEIHALDDRHFVNVIASHESGPNARCADSESRFLATKKFSCSPASCLVAARQNGFFARIDCG